VGKYVEIEPEELEAVEIESTHTIDIDTFVPEEEIGKRYHERPYYIVPDGKSGEEAFAIRDAMKDKGRVALARIVFAKREHIMAIEPWGKGLLGTTLRYDYEVRDEKEAFKGIPSPRVPKEMVELASHILDKKAGHFDPAKFKDEYELALRKLVKPNSDRCSAIPEARQSRRCSWAPARRTPAGWQQLLAYPSVDRRTGCRQPAQRRNEHHPERRGSQGGRSLVVPSHLPRVVRRHPGSWLSARCLTRP
jgi:Ku protein